MSLDHIQHVMGPVQHVMGPVQHVIYLSNMSLELSNMSLDLSSISFDPCPAFHLTPVSIVAVGWNKTFSLGPEKSFGGKFENFTFAHSDLRPWDI
ncbi:hypothetical protein TNCV_686421 [Trichonephila clavipes]|nr:hypothetical protein TNCV_686421 [Trichonephila clavipes]